MQKFQQTCFLVLGLLVLFALVLKSISVFSGAINDRAEAELRHTAVNITSALNSKLSGTVALVRSVASHAGHEWALYFSATKGSDISREILQQSLDAARDIDPTILRLELIDQDHERLIAASGGPGLIQGVASRSADWSHEKLISRGILASIDNDTQIAHLRVPVGGDQAVNYRGSLYARIDLNDWLTLKKNDFQRTTEAGLGNLKVEVVLKKQCGFEAPVAKRGWGAILPESDFKFAQGYGLPYPFFGEQACVTATIDLSRLRVTILYVAITALMVIIGIWLLLIAWHWRFIRQFVRPVERMHAVLQKSISSGKEIKGLCFGSDGLWLANLLDQLVLELNSVRNDKLWKLEATHTELHRTRARLERVASDSGVVMISWSGHDLKDVNFTGSLLEFMRFMGLTGDVANYGWRSFYRLVSKDQRVSLRDLLSFAKDDEVKRATIIFSGIEGRRVYDVRLSGHPVEGGMRRVDLIALNITDKTEAEHALMASESRKSAIINVSPEAILVVTCEGHILEANAAAEKILGFDRILLTGMNVDNLFSDENDWSRLKEKFFPEKSPVGSIPSFSPMALFCRSESGEKIPVEVWAGSSAFTKEPGFVCIYMHDLRDRLARDLSLVIKSRQLQAVFSMSPAGIVVFDEVDQLSVFNDPIQSWLKGVGITLKIGMQRVDFNRQLNDSGGSDTRRKRASGKVNGEKILTFSEGSRLTLKCTERILGDDAGRTHSTVMFFTDITEEYQLDALKNGFLATAAHELRTPLAVILGFSELLSDENYSDDEKKQLARSISEHSIRLGKLLEDLLDLAKIDANGANVFNFKPVSFVEMFSYFLEGSAPLRNMQMHYLGHPINLRIDEEIKGRMILCDESKFGRVVANLLSNAAKYSQSDSPIDIRLSYRPGVVEHRPMLLEIVDHGIGMTAKELGHVFERFWRADSQSGSIPGTGLGLSICKEIMDRHDGLINVESVKGIGTTIKLFFPEHANNQVATIQ